jgi:ATP/maltotriose-dependent transcriptional regulator MalT
VEQIAESIWMSGDMIRLLGWLEALPEEMVRSHPRLCIFHAWIFNILGEFEATEARLRDAQEGLATGPVDLDAGLATTQGMLFATRAIIAIMNGDAMAPFDLSNQAMKKLPEDNLVWRSVVNRNLGNAYLLTGQMAPASQAFLEAFHSSFRAGNLYMALVSLYELTELQILQGQLHQAAGTCRQALELADEGGTPVTVSGAIHGDE